MVALAKFSKQSRVAGLVSCAAALTLALGWSNVAGAVGMADFTPHRAVYELDLSETQKSAGVARAGGVFEFEWTDACEGWTVSQRSRIEVAFDDGRAINFGWALNTWESKDGERYRFFLRRIYAGGEPEEVRGEAWMSESGGKATFKLPTTREVTLPKGTIFPTRHSIELMQAAKDKTLPLWRVVFDGAGDDGIYGVSAAPGVQVAPGSAPGLDSPLLEDQASWRLQLAFFGLGEDATEPEQEQRLRLFANGIADQLTFDYGEFALDAKLSELDSLPAMDCGG